MPIDLSVDAGIATITLNRPERLNSFDEDHYAKLSQAFVAVRDRPEIRVAIVTGAGEKAFSTGSDLKSPMTRFSDFSDLMQTQNNQIPNRGLEVWKPIVAAINGYCIGGGLCLMLAADIRIAADHATFGLSEVKRGLLAGNGGVTRVARQLPHAIAMELLLTGDSIDAATAERWGLVNKVVSLQDLMPTAREYARRIADGAPLAVQATKEVALRGRDMEMSSALRLEELFIGHLYKTLDCREGQEAFAKKRQPRFEGR